MIDPQRQANKYIKNMGKDIWNLIQWNHFCRMWFDHLVGETINALIDLEWYKCI